MSITSIVVFVDSTPAGQARVRYAVGLAQKHRAHVIGIFIASPNAETAPADAYVRGQDAIREMLERHENDKSLKGAAASLGFMVETAKEDVEFEFRVIKEGDRSEQAKLHSLHADLIVVGYPSPGGLPENWTAESLLLETGVPFLIVPDSWEGGPIAERILVGWNASREARRALTDSLPLLEAASLVKLLVIDSDENPRHGEEPGADVALYLTRHGVKVDVEQVRSEGKKIAGVMQDIAAANDVDLIVIGAFSHSRAREMAFGGVTRALLGDIRRPLFIAH